MLTKMCDQIIQLSLSLPFIFPQLLSLIYPPLTAVQYYLNMIVLFNNSDWHLRKANTNTIQISEGQFLEKKEKTKTLA